MQQKTRERKKENDGLGGAEMSFFFGDFDEQQLIEIHSDVVLLDKKGLMPVNAHRSFHHLSPINV